MNITKPTKVQT